MKNRLILFAVAAALICGFAASCAKGKTTSSNEAAKRYFEAWIRYNHPDAVQTELGYYILDDVPGDGELIGDEEESVYVFADYVTKDLDGNILSSSSVELAQQLGDYNETYFYGPTIIYRGENNYYTGLSDALKTMRVGGYRKVAVPSWLLTHNTYKKVEDYYNKELSSTDPGVYEFRVTGRTNDIVKWQIDSIEAYMAHQLAPVDSTVYGFYYHQTQAPTDTTKFEEAAQVQIYYIGRLLNGQVFDTNIKDTAKFYHIYNPSTEYGPATITWSNASVADFTMTTYGSSSESTMIDGFGYTLFNMRTGEKGTGIFYSDLGYGSSGSGNSIPAYAPLRFDIEVVGVDEDDLDDE